MIRRIGDMPVSGGLTLPHQLLMTDSILSLDQYLSLYGDLTKESVAFDLDFYAFPYSDHIYDWYVAVNPLIPMKSGRYVYVEHSFGGDELTFSLGMLDGLRAKYVNDRIEGFSFTVREMTGWNQTQIENPFPKDWSGSTYESEKIDFINHVDLIFDPRPLSTVKNMRLDALCYQLFTFDLSKSFDAFQEIVTGFLSRDALRAGLLANLQANYPKAIATVLETNDSELDEETLIAWQHQANAFYYLANETVNNARNLFHALRNKNLESMRLYLGGIELSFPRKTSANQ